MNEQDLAYAAGIIDGEGCMSIDRHKRKHIYTYGLSIQVSMKNPAVPKWLNSNFGGSACITRQSRGAFNQNPLHKWSIFGTEAQQLILKLFPYLIEKKLQATLMLSFPIGKGSPPKLSEIEKLQQELLHQTYAGREK